MEHTPLIPPPPLLFAFSPPSLPLPPPPPPASDLIIFAWRISLAHRRSSQSHYRMLVALGIRISARFWRLMVEQIRWSLMLLTLAVELITQRLTWMIQFLLGRNLFLKELGLWQRLLHPNIVQFLGVLKHPDRVIFLTEYLTKGTLHEILKNKGRLDSLTAVAYALDIARGMNYLHQHKPHPIIHRDLTPRNVLQDEAGRLKVSDFGLSKIVQEKDSYGSYKMTGGTGSYRYMAPEVYRRESYGKSVDVFSFALIVYEMFQGAPANRAESPEVVADKRAYEDSRPSLSSIVYPTQIKTLLRKCWHENPQFRPSFEEIIIQLEAIEESLKEKKLMGYRAGCCSIS